MRPQRLTSRGRCYYAAKRLIDLHAAFALIAFAARVPVILTALTIDQTHLGTSGLLAMAAVMLHNAFKVLSGSMLSLLFRRNPESDSYQVTVYQTGDRHAGS